jgi:hypothetical protein
MARRKTKAEREAILTEAYFFPYAHARICEYHDISRTTLRRWRYNQLIERVVKRLVLDLEPFEQVDVDQPSAGLSIGAPLR